MAITYPCLQEKTLERLEDNDIFPDEGYIGLKKVFVENITSIYEISSQAELDELQSNKPEGEVLFKVTTDFGGYSTQYYYLIEDTQS